MRLGTLSACFTSAGDEMLGVQRFKELENLAQVTSGPEPAAGWLSRAERRHRRVPGKTPAKGQFDGRSDPTERLHHILHCLVEALVLPRGDSLMFDSRGRLLRDDTRTI